MNTSTLTLSDVAHISPLPGRSIIHLDHPATMSDLGLLHIPDSAQKKSTGDILWPGTVLKISPRKESHPDYQPEQVGDGDRVLVALMMDDVGREIIVTLNTRIWAGLS